MRSIVSIPDRYSKNKAIKNVQTDSKEFQFLIGTLKTMGWDSISLAWKSFQFLIGTLKTYDIYDTSRMVFCFNS